MKYCTLAALVLFGAVSGSVPVYAEYFPEAVPVTQALFAENQAKTIPLIQTLFAADSPEIVSFAKALPKKNKPEQPLFNWSLLWAGSWEENKTLNNRLDLRLGFPLPGLVLRGQAIDKRPLDFSPDPPWGEASDGTDNFSGGLYHTPTGSRLLYGILDEWGLAARVRNPWLRSAPFAENHKPMMADLKTTASATKEPETYLYLSSPRLALIPGTAWRGFASAQTGTEQGFLPDFSGGLETQIGTKATALLEGFYSGGELPARTSKSWFSDPPPLPEREYQLYALGLLVNVPWVSLSSDWAYSETFTQGRDVYINAGIRLNPSVSAAPGKAPKPMPWSVSLAADGAGEHFTGRDGANPGANFRTAGKFEWKGNRSSLFRISTSLRGPGLGEDFNRSSSGVYYRFPAPPAAGRYAAEANAPFPLRISRISLKVDRNAADPQKTVDEIDGTVGLSLNLPPVPVPGFSSQTGGKKSVPKGSPLGIAFSGSLAGRSAIDETPIPYPWPQSEWDFDSAKAACELSWSPGIFQFKTKAGYKVTAKKEGQWDTAISIGIRFKHGRLNMKVASPKLPEKWNYTIAWRLEKK